MQTITVIQTIEWIDSLYSAKAKETLFTQRVRSDSDKVSSTLDVSHELARISPIIANNKAAVEVLKAFELEQLADLNFGSKYAQATLSQKPGEGRDIIFMMVGKWRIMITAAKAYKELTIPAELANRESSDSIISIELQFDGVMPPALVLAKAINALEELYESIANAYQIDSREALKIVKIDSGSNVKIDCKGLGSVVKHLKDFFLEAWHKVRHKRVEEVIENNKALLSSLAVVQQVDSLVSSGSITHEDAERIKHRIISSTFSLLDNRALPGNIPNNENVDNIKMLDRFSPKLLNLRNDPNEAVETVDADVVTEPKKSPLKKRINSPTKPNKKRTSPIPKNKSLPKKNTLDNRETNEDE